jgi:ketosteroid isomerase-like protein
MTDQTEVVRRVFDAVERRDVEALMSCYAEDVEIHEAPSLPYGGVYRGHRGALMHAAAWLEAWGRYQGPDEQRLDATFMDGPDGNVSVLFHHRAVDAGTGERIDDLEVSVYRVRDDKVVRSQMFHADSAALARFLETRR